MSVTTAPSAAARVTSLAAAPGMSWGPATPYGTNCTYTLTATVTNPNPVAFYDFGPESTFAPDRYSHPTAGTTTVRWTPTQPGRHRIMAYQTFTGGPAMDTAALDIQVGTGINTGSACIVPS
ncbi:hypothetical protein ABZ942_19360 [Nocardia sp. NPDC046473]|uniref:hypothetical protein n=1 Tax=Nocardia sp. NPDC046473 TaxID=3155733 RepID=UPI0033CE71A4